MLNLQILKSQLKKHDEKCVKKINTK